MATEKLVSMKRSPTKEEAMYPSMPSSDYPSGLCLYLDEEQIKKLGIALPKAGVTLALEAKALVTSVTQTDSQDGGAQRSLCLQITALGLDTDSDD